MRERKREEQMNERWGKCVSNSAFSFVSVCQDMSVQGDI